MNTQSYKSNERSNTLTILLVVSLLFNVSGFIGILVGYSAMEILYDSKIAVILLLITGIIQFVSLIGMWKMYKFAFYVFIVTIIINILIINLQNYTGIFNIILGLLFPAFTILIFYNNVMKKN